jgi:hypothetical protein
MDMMVEEEVSLSTAPAQWKQQSLGPTISRGLASDTMIYY